MDRRDLLRTPSFWMTKIQIDLYNCAEKFMEDSNRNRKQLAEYLGVSKGYVTQLLSGDYNYTLEKLVDLSLKLGYVPQVEFKPLEQILLEDERVYSDTQQVGSAWCIYENNVIPLIPA